MRGLVLLVVLVRALSCAGVPPLQPVACDDSGGDAAARAATHHINRHHHHGYKYQLHKLRSSSVQKGDPACEMLLEMDLLETMCHVVDPRHFEECEGRSREETPVEANCNVTLKVKEGNATVITYSCKSEAASAEDLVAICPDCPTLLPLHDPMGLESVNLALKKFNEDSNHTSYFKLMEVGRLSTQYMFTGQSYFAEFALVETNCSAQTPAEEVPSCQPLCEDQAQHGFCVSTVLGDGQVFVDCKIYEAQNSSSHQHRHRHRHAGFSRKSCSAWRGRGKHTYPTGPFPDRPHHRHRHRHHHHPHRHHHHHHGVRPTAFPHPGLSQSSSREREPRPTPRWPQRGRPPHRKDIQFTPHAYPLPHCQGFVKIPPSIHPICPRPPHSHYDRENRWHLPPHLQPLPGALPTTTQPDEDY